MIPQALRSRTVVAVSGGFDPPHRGHISYFLEARRLGDTLVVLVDSDDFVATKHRVLMPQVDRAAVIRELRFVSMVLLSTQPDVSALLEALRPDIYVVGPDHREVESIPEYATCLRLGIKVVRLDLVRQGSSSDLVRRYDEPVE